MHTVKNNAPKAPKQTTEVGGLTPRGAGWRACARACVHVCVGGGSKPRPSHSRVRDGQCADRRAADEHARAQPCDGSGNRKLGEAGTVPEGTVFDLGQALGQLDALEAAALTECSALDACQVRRKLEPFYAPAPAKSRVTDLRQRRRQHNLNEPSAIHERPRAEHLEALRQRHTPQVLALGKGVRALETRIGHNIGLQAPMAPIRHQSASNPHGNTRALASDSSLFPH